MRGKGKEQGPLAKGQGIIPAGAGKSFGGVGEGGVY